MRTGADRTLELLEAQVGKTLAEVETPVAVVDLDRLEANLRDLQSYADSHGIAVWPHTKTHKSPEIGMLQLELGAGGLTVAKTGEAQVFRDAGATAPARPLPAGRRGQVGAARPARLRGARPHGGRRRQLRGRGPVGRARTPWSNRDPARRDGRRAAPHRPDDRRRRARARAAALAAPGRRGCGHQLLPGPLPRGRGDDPRAGRCGGRAPARDARCVPGLGHPRRPHLRRLDADALPDARDLRQRAALRHVRAARPHRRAARGLRAARRGDRHLRRRARPDRDRRGLEDADVGHRARAGLRRDRRAAPTRTCTS